MSPARPSTTMTVSRGALVLMLAAVLSMVSGCAWPRDTSGSLGRVSGGILRVGVSVNPPWTRQEPGGQISGSEVDLIRGYATSIDATIHWSVDAESVLATRTRDGQLDVVIGGLTAKSPWTDQMALTRPYRTVRSEDGKTVKMVMGTQLGENALLVSLERYLSQQERLR